MDGTITYSCNATDCLIEINNHEDKFNCEVCFQSKEEGKIIVNIGDLVNALYLAGYRVDKFDTNHFSYIEKIDPANC